jgi:hypothetical protein
VVDFCPIVFQRIAVSGGNVAIAVYLEAREVAMFAHNFRR